MVPLLTLPRADTQLLDFPILGRCALWSWTTPSPALQYAFSTIAHLPSDPQMRTLCSWTARCCPTLSPASVCAPLLPFISSEDACSCSHGRHAAVQHLHLPCTLRPYQPSYLPPYNPLSSTDAHSVFMDDTLLSNTLTYHATCALPYLPTLHSPPIIPQMHTLCSWTTHYCPTPSPASRRSETCTAASLEGSSCGGWVDGCTSSRGGARGAAECLLAAGFEMRRQPAARVHCAAIAALAWLSLNQTGWTASSSRETSARLHACRRAFELAHSTAYLFAGCRPLTGGFSRFAVGAARHGVDHHGAGMPGCFPPLRCVGRLARLRPAALPL